MSMRVAIRAPRFGPAPDLWGALPVGAV